MNKVNIEKVKSVVNMTKMHIKNVVKFDKTRKRGDEISLLFFSLVIFIFLVMSLLRFLIVGKALDDFVFAFGFGWIKYIIYFFSFLLIIPLCFGYRVKFKLKAFCFLLFGLIIICWTTQTLSLLINNKNHLWTSYQNLNLVNITQNYFKTWWTNNSINNYYGFFASPITWKNFSVETFFPSYATGGMISNVLTGIFNYGFFATNFLANFIIIFGLSCFCFFDHPLILFIKSKQFIIYMRAKKQQRKINHQLQQKQLILKKEKLLIDKQVLKASKNQKSQTINDDLSVASAELSIKTTSILKTSPNLGSSAKLSSTNYLTENSTLTPFGKINPQHQKTRVSNSKGTLVVKKSLEDSILNNSTNTSTLAINSLAQPSKCKIAPAQNKISYNPAPIIINATYKLPSLPAQTLNINNFHHDENHQQAMLNQEKLLFLFKQFNVKGQINGFHLGSAITKYEVSLTPGVKVNKITRLEDDIKLCLGNNNIRIEAPIPGKSMVGIETPNKHIITVSLQEVMQHLKITDEKQNLLFAIGKDSIGNYLLQSLAQMPHLLIAGTTGSGKSVFINTFLISLLLRYRPHEIKLLLIDPKWVELIAYNNIPHLLTPVINDAEQAVLGLKVVLLEMERRYQLLACHSARNIDSYNSKISNDHQKLPYYIVVIDELADLMIKNSKAIEEGIMRITQMGRAAGIHLVVATQRPSTDIITGVIKNNITARVSFKVSSWMDSRTVIDSAGAEKLIGKGDMIFVGVGNSSPIRMQAPWISEEEVLQVLDFIKKQDKSNYDNNFIAAMDDLK